MIATPTAVMFGLVYLNTYALDHAYFSETRACVALVMGAAMGVIMLAFVLRIYASRRINAALFAGCAAVCIGALWLVRSQATIGDISWMPAMIPHHSIAMLTSERANIHHGSARTHAGGLDHRGAAPGDRRDEGLDQ